MMIGPKSSEQPSTTQAAFTLPEAEKGSTQADDQSRGVEGTKDKGKGKETKPPIEAKDAAQTRAPKTEARNKEVDSQAKDVPPPKPSQKEDPSKAKK
nr:hypothetical protein CFP56_46041 [Quercus suber]